MGLIYLSFTVDSLKTTSNEVVPFFASQIYFLRVAECDCQIFEREGYLYEPELLLLKG